MTRWTILAATVLAAAWHGGAWAQPISGIYVGAGAGANFMQNSQARLDSAGRTLSAGGISFNTGVVGVGSVGYGFGNGLRVEIEGDYRNNRRDEPNGTARSSAGGYERKFGGMVNALFDLDIGSPYVFPYLGGGVGYMEDQYRLKTNIINPGAFQQLDSLGGTQGSFAYQGIGGVSFPVPYVPGLSLTAEYRFMGLAGSRGYDGRLIQNFNGSVTSFPTHERLKEDYNHSLMLGVRYAFNVAPPPPPAAVTPPVSQAPATARTYLVFFDWDRADLTDRARQIVAQAAQASTRVQTTRIEVNGYTDSSGTARYNLGLSQRRAQSVAAELVRDGVARSEITIQGFGETHPLVPTAQGVREPQNRRVEIILR